MTRQQLLIEKAITEKLGWVLDGKTPYDYALPDGNRESPTFTHPALGWEDIFLYMVPWINQQKNAAELWWWIYGRLPAADIKNDRTEMIPLLDFIHSTPEQISEAFLRATGAWTKEMEA